MNCMNKFDEKRGKQVIGKSNFKIYGLDSFI